jgi:polyisoprenyl-teichoic acid--peptidoglycan teichoic acid transferase
MNNNRSLHRKKKRKTRRWVRVVLMFMTIFIIGGGVYLYNVYSNVANAIDNMNSPIDREVSEKRTEEVLFKDKDPISILLVGVDEREGDNGRTDSMLVMTLNPETGTTKIVSIPRDTRAELVDPEEPEDYTVTKINHAYAFGGIEMTIASIEHFLNVPIDYYIEVNMEGFKDIVDAVGGIDVYNEYEFELDGVFLTEGQHHLDGEEALQYARMRKQDPLGDFGRQERQKEVISKVIDKGTSLKALTAYEDVLEALEKNVKTNLTLDEMVALQRQYKDAVKTIEKLEMPGEGDTIDTVWYYIVEDETRQQLSDELRTHLELPTSTVEASNIY